MDGPLPGWTVEEFRHIAVEQQSRENLIARLANRVLICDTNAFATGTWYERYFGSRDPVVDEIGAGDKVDLYVLAAPDVAFVQDGFRDGERIRDWMHARFIAQLEVGIAPWIEVRGDFTSRNYAAESAIRNIC